MTTYARLTVKGHEDRRARAGWYEIIEEGPVWVLARPVDEEGRDRSHYQADGTLVDVQALIAVDAITRRQPGRWNNRYATLEVDPEKS